MYLYIKILRLFYNVFLFCYFMNGLYEQKDKKYDDKKKEQQQNQLYTFWPEAIALSVFCKIFVGHSNLFLRSSHHHLYCCLLLLLMLLDVDAIRQSEHFQLNFISLSQSFTLSLSFLFVLHIEFSFFE